VKIKSIILENFRAYKNHTVIPFSNLTALIGKNDSGKSTVLETLDIFFDGGTVKIESNDASKSGDAKNVRIGVVFSDLPEELILDSNAMTTLANEYLLNEEGHLEIHKVFNCSLQTPKVIVFARAVHPTAKDVADILQKPQKDLKAIIKEKNLEKSCNQTENPSMRYAIYQAHPELQVSIRDVPLNDENAKAIWGALQNYLPIFALFQSDRASKDQDPEVQNSMKVAIEQALDGLGIELERITEQVSQKAQETAERTLVKLQTSFPNLDLASTLQPKFRKSAWKNVLKIDLEADDGIPLNKRGSGFRRLVLLSFFQAEAEKKRAESGAGAQQSRCVIYAIEEPETSQHPENQEQIIRALCDLTEAGDQVILTTHVPRLAGLIPLDSLRYIDVEPDTQNVRVRSGTPDVYKEIAEALGVLPDSIPRKSLKVAVLVEGKNDIDALRSLASVLTKAGKIEPIQEESIFWTIGGGETLKDWIERSYLEKLNVPQVIIRDSDRSAAAMPLSAEKRKWLQDMQANPNVTAFITRKRNMDNYIHPATISRMTNNVISIPPETDIDFVRMADEFGQQVTAAIENPKLKLCAVTLDNKPIPARKKNAKQIISAYLMCHMTEQELNERASYVHEDGTTRNEISEWIEAICAKLA
jgi:ABC-type cobalamin/Fe3+-siderophores transport system ATPase subunit